MKRPSSRPRRPRSRKRRGSGLWRRTVASTPRFHAFTCDADGRRTNMFPGPYTVSGMALSLQFPVVGMSASRSNRGHRSWTMQVAVISMAMLVLAVGFCVLDGGDHDGTDDHACLDLCLGMLTVSLPVVLTGGLPLTGLTAAYGFAQFNSFDRHVPAPPPKLLS